VLLLVESTEGSRGVGANDGKLLGLIVGFFVVVVGKTEADGLIVGFIVGFNVGALVGVSVGLSEGGEVGALVGLIVGGGTEGAPVGLMLGLIVGLFVGINVDGLGVGSGSISLQIPRVDLVDPQSSRGTRSLLVAVKSQIPDRQSPSLSQPLHVG